MSEAGPERGPASDPVDSHRYGHDSLTARPWVTRRVKIKRLPQRSDIKLVMRKNSDETVLLLCIVWVVKGHTLNMGSKNNKHRVLLKKTKPGCNHVRKDPCTFNAYTKGKKRGMLNLAVA